LRRITKPGDRKQNAKKGEKSRDNTTTNRGSGTSEGPEKKKRQEQAIRKL